ncbi:hypothetical protein D9M68_661860 [compost metagenome]
MGDQAGPLIGTRRATVGHLGHRHGHHTAVGQGLQHLAQLLGLLARLPGVGHARLLGRGLQTVDAVVHAVNPWRHNQPIIGNLLGPHAHLAQAGVDRVGPGPHPAQPALGDEAAVGPRDVPQTQPTMNHAVAHRAHDELAGGFDQRDLQGGVETAQVARCCGAPETTSDDDHPFTGLRSHTGRRQCRSGCQAGLEKCASLGHAGVLI